MRKICNFIIKISIYSLVFLMPLFWLPWTIEIHEFNKQYLLLFFVNLGTLAWLAKLIFVRKKLYFRRTPLDIFVFALLVAVILSASFSIEPVSSWLGTYGRFSDSASVLIMMALLYFLVVNNMSVNTVEDRLSVSQKETVSSTSNNHCKKTWGVALDKIFGLLFLSCLVTIIIAYGSIFGLWEKMSFLPQIMSIPSFNSVSSSLEGLSIFLVMFVSFATSILLRTTKKTSKIKVDFIKFANFTLVIAAMILLVIINFQVAWLILAISMFFLLAAIVWTGMLHQKNNWLSVPVLILFISIIYLSGFASNIGLDTLGNDGLQSELLLNQSTSWEITWQTLKEYPVLGSGMGSFMLDFTNYRPVGLNETSLWNIKFDRANNYFAELAATTGITGSFFYLALLGIFFVVAFSYLSRLKKQESRRNTTLLDNYSLESDKVVFLALFLACFTLGIAQFFYPQTIVLSFFFWFLMALIMITWRNIRPVAVKNISISLKERSEVGLVLNVVLLIMACSFLGTIYLGGKFYLADVQFRSLLVNEDEIDVVKAMETIVDLNQYNGKYRRDLSRLYLNSAWQEANKNEEERDVNRLQNLIANSIEQAKLVTTLNPNSVLAWENLGVVYRDAMGLVSGTFPFALDAFAKASELEPANPLLYRERCRLSLMSEEKDWDEVLGFCQKAIDLKPNYLDAHIQLALAFEQKGELENAKERMQATLNNLKGVSFQRGSDLAQAATEIYFQLGRINFNLPDIEEAINMFEQSVIISPQYANARYGLALAYQQDGRMKDALNQLILVDQLVPGNQEIMKMITQIEQLLGSNKE